jgi:hypothetical protein
MAESPLKETKDYLNAPQPPESIRIQASVGKHGQICCAAMTILRSSTTQECVMAMAAIVAKVESQIQGLAKGVSDATGIPVKAIVDNIAYYAHNSAKGDQAIVRTEPKGDEKDAGGPA